MEKTSVQSLHTKSLSCEKKRGEAKLRLAGGREGGRGTLYCMVMSLKIRVRAVQGRVALP
jgi:hypothetical protein